MYDIEYNASDRVMTIVLRGFWTRATLLRFVADVGARGLYLLARHGRFAVFVDCRHYPVQSAEVINGFVPILSRVAARGLPLCMLFETTLCKLQAGRLASGAPSFVTINEHDARAWLADRVAELPRYAVLKRS